jgi:hypothetical protein
LAPFSENLVVPGIEPGTSASVARDSDHETTEAEICIQNTIRKTSREATAGDILNERILLLVM